MKLDILAGRQLALVAAVLAADLAEEPQTCGLQEAARNFDPHHEAAELGFVVVQPEPLQPHHVGFGQRLIGRLNQPVPLLL